VNPPVPTDPAAGGPAAVDPAGAGGPPAPAPAVGGRAAVDPLLRVLGGLLSFVGGFLAAALAVLLVPLRLWELLGPLAELLEVDPTSGPAALRVPVAIPLAVVGNLFLVRFARQVTGVRWGALLPGVGWFLLIVAALQATTEGDRLLMPDDWVATLTLFGGTVTLVIATVLSLTSPPRSTRAHTIGDRDIAPPLP
jgi:hypothetical protein